MRRDLWRLATPLLAVGVSFVVVLIIGAASPGSPTPTISPTPTPTPTTTPTPPALHSAITITAASASPKTRVLPRGSTVTVYSATTLQRIVTNHLTTKNSYTTQVPVHSYLVCLRPPGNWRSASGDTISLGSWICKAKQIGPGPATVNFSLVPLPAPASGAGG
jgi:hypothetical protein